MKKFTPKHGYRGTLTYNSWKLMIQRCANPKAYAYENYGGRGIKVCKQWRVFLNFLADMGERPEGLTLDRIDSNGNYEKSNCRWSTMREQNSNRRNTILIKGKTAAEWARIYGIPRQRLEKRLAHGFSFEMAVSKSKYRGGRDVVRGSGSVVLGEQ